MPDKWALAKRSPISTQNQTALMIELQQIGLDLNDVRITNLWGHLPKKRPAGKKNSEAILVWERDYQENYISAVRAVAKCRYVLLCGAAAIKAFLPEPDGQYLGLPAATVRFPDKIVIPAPTMTAFAFKPVGELRFCLATLAKELKR